MNKLSTACLLAVALALAVLAGPISAQGLAEQLGAGSLTLQPADFFDEAYLRITGPDGYVLHRSFASGEPINVDLVSEGRVSVEGRGESVSWESPASLADGRYRYELRTTSAEGEVTTQSGAFVAFGGAAMTRSEMRAQLAALNQGLRDPGANPGPAVTPGDSGGLHTKTQAVLSETDNITITDGTNDGQTFFSLDSDSPVNSAYFMLVNELGDLQIAENTTFTPSGRFNFMHFDRTSNNIGLFTTTPTRDLEILSGDPAIVLDDSAGVEWTLNHDSDSTEFDIVSTANGASLRRHFYINRGAPVNQLVLQPNGIGIGTLSPSATVEIEGNSGTSQFLIDEQNANASVEVMFNLVCNCSPGFRMQNTVNGEIWFFRHTSAGDFSFDNVGSAGLEARLDSNGNFFIQGSLSQGSSRALKENLVPANGDSVLETLSALDLYEWSYIDQKARHFGPMAEEFSAAYGLGASDAKIAPADMAGLALAASKALAEKNVALEAENATLKEQLSAIVARLEALEQQ